MCSSQASLVASQPFRILAKTAVVLVTLLLVFWLLTVFERLRWTESLQAQLQAQRQDFDQQLTQFTVLPSILANDPRLITALLTPSDAAAEVANNYLKYTNETSQSAAIFLMDTQGNTLAASNFDQPLSFVGKNYGFRPYFSSAMNGRQATFFAVGATTGIPGYFIANPVSIDGEVMGVVAVKIEPTALPAVWSKGSEHAIVTDELGVGILATDTRFLYAPSRDLTSGELDAIALQRRYTIDTRAQVERLDESRWKFLLGDGTRAHFSVISLPLQSEPWTLHTLQSNQKIRFRAMFYLLGFLVLLSIAALLLRNSRQQKQLSLARKEQAMRLERLVQERTRDLETAQQALIAESNFAMLGRMSAAINHEINQPLASLRLNLATLRQIFQQQSNPDNDIQEIVVDSDRTTKRIGRVIETLRSVARQGLTDSEPVNLSMIAYDAVETVKRERPIAVAALASHEASERARIDHQECVVLGNEVLLQQAILNLLYNALDAVVKNDFVDPQVVVSVERVGDFVQLVVTDNGAGVSPEMEAHLFKPFESGPSNSAGLGLGLTLARQIAQDHAGSLDFVRTQTSGSRFIMSLPWKNDLLAQVDRPQHVAD